MLLRHGLLLSFFAVFLQIAVFLQPLLPEKFQISPVCETITLALLQSSHSIVDTVHHEHSSHHINATHILTTNDEQHHHDASHKCQYCTVYANVVLPPNSDITEILVKTHVQYIWLQQQFEHVYFALQRLYLLPQGRAPPLFV